MKVDMKFGSGSTNDAAKDIASSTEAYAHLKPTNFSELLTAKALQHKEGEWFHSSVIGLSTLGGISSCCVYYMFRRTMVLYEGLIAGSLIMASVGSGFSLVLRKRVLQPQILSGTVNCEVCAMTRGAVYQTFTAVAVPWFVAFSLTSIIAEKYGYIKIPSFSVLQKPTAEFAAFWFPKFQRVFRWSLPLLALNAAAGAFCAYKEMKSAEQVRNLVTREEVDKMMSSAFQFAERL